MSKKKNDSKESKAKEMTDFEDGSFDFSADDFTNDDFPERDFVDDWTEDVSAEEIKNSSETSETQEVLLDKNTNITLGPSVICALNGAGGLFSGGVIGGLFGAG